MPLLVFVNGKSGGGQGRELLGMLSSLLNPHQTFDVTEFGPLPGFVHGLNVLVLYVVCVRVCACVCVCALLLRVGVFVHTTILTLFSLDTASVPSAMCPSFK